MEPAGPVAADHKSLVLALSQAGDWLKALQKRQREGLRNAQGSLDTSLAVLLREEERLRAQARGERARLQHELAAVRAANEQAGRAVAATIQALQRQLGSLHRRLLAAPQPAAPQPAAGSPRHSTPPASEPAEMAQEAAALLSQAAGLSVTLTWAHFVPQPRVAAAVAAAAAAALGELRLQEEEVQSLAPSKIPVRDRESVLPIDGSSHAPGIHKILLPLLPGDHPPQRAGLAFRGQTRSAGKGVTLGPEEPGPERALPATGKPAAVSGRGPLMAETPAVPAAAAAAVSHSGRLALPAAMLLGSSPLLLVQEDDSDSGGEQGGSRSLREGAEPGSRGPSARDSSCRWASAESLGTPSGVRPGPAGAGRWVELGFQQVAERGSTSLEADGSSHCQVLRGVQRGQVAAAAAGGGIPPHQHQSVRFPGGAASSMGWLPAQQAPTRSLSAPPPPPCNRLVGQWGTQGSKQGQLRLPHGLHATPAAGCLYVVDFGNRRLQELGGARRILPLRGGRAYFDVAVGRGGCLALSNATGRCVELYSARGLLLQAMHEGFRSPRGIATSPQGEFLVADTHLGTLHILGVPMTRGRQLVRRDAVRGFHKPYLVASNAQSGEVAVSERGLDGGCCVKVLSPTWQVLRVLGGRSSPPVLTNPWGVSLDEAGRVLVADWGRHAHSVLCYPPEGHGWAVATQGLSSPRGLALLGEHHLVVADSMHHCLKTFQYC